METINSNEYSKDNFGRIFNSYGYEMRGPQFSSLSNEDEDEDEEPENDYKYLLIRR